MKYVDYPKFLNLHKSKTKTVLSKSRTEWPMHQSGLGFHKETWTKVVIDIQVGTLQIRKLIKYSVWSSFEFIHLRINLPSPRTVQGSKLCSEVNSTFRTVNVNSMKKFFFIFCISDNLTSSLFIEVSQFKLKYVL